MATLLLELQHFALQCHVLHSYNILLMNDTLFQCLLLEIHIAFVFFLERV